MQKSRVCSFTGHRIIEKNHQNRINEFVMRSIEFAYEKGCRLFLAGGAVGFDTIAARQVILFRMSHPDVRLRLVLPCRAQDKKWGERQKDNYDFTLSASDEVIYTSEEYTRDCMKKRNYVLARDADIVIAYVSRSNSGSAQTVRMAQKLGKEVYNLYPTLEKNFLNEDKNE